MNQIVAGSPGRQCPSPTDPCGDGQSAAGALLATPRALAVALDGSLYVADPLLHRVRRIGTDGNISTVAGTGQACTDPNAPACGDGGPATAAALGGPYGVWVNPSGDLFIADGPRGIREVLPNGNISTVGIGRAYDVRSVAGDATGNLYAATNNPDYLIQINLTSGQARIVVGTGTSGYNGCCDEGSLLPGTEVQINRPQSLSVGLDGKVVFADSANSLIRAYVPPSEPSASGHVINLGGQVTNSTPQSGDNGDGNWADQTLLDHPQAVTVTRGVLYIVADTNNHAVRQIGPGPASEQLGQVPPVTDTHNAPVSPLGPGPASEQPANHPPVNRPPVNRRPVKRAPVKRALITCKTAANTAKRGHKRHKTRVKPFTCRAKRVTGKATLRGSRREQATLRRRHVVYAIGTSVSTVPRRLRLLVTQLRPLPPGRYTLTLRHRHRHRWIARRLTITLR